jgi:hypothetical protein
LATLGGGALAMRAAAFFLGDCFAAFLGGHSPRFRSPVRRNGAVMDSGNNKIVIQLVNESMTGGFSTDERSRK